MAEELVPPDFLISPAIFESAFLVSESPPNIHQLALDGRLVSLKNRFICWRMFLGILPKTGPLEVWVDRVTELRRKYQEIIDAQRVIFI